MLDKGISLYLGNIEQSYRHVHEAVECLLVVKGELEVEVDDEAFLLGADDLLVVNINQIHMLKGNESNLVLCFRVEKEYIERECRELLPLRFVCNSAKETEPEKKAYFECKRLLTKMLLTYTEKKKGYELELRSIFFLFLSYLEAHFSVSPPEGKSAVPSGGMQGLEQVLDYIRTNYDQEIPMEDMARQIHLSPSYFSKFFKQKIGIGFLEYVNQIRLGHALKSLLETDTSILKIALENGFANQKSFSERFKKEYGENPSEYRKKHQKAVPDNGEETIRYEFDLQLEDGIIPFLKYIHQHSTEDSMGEAAGVETRITLPEVPVASLNRPDFMINVEIMRNLQNPEILEQLAEVQDRLHFTYVYFRAFDEEWEYANIRGDLFDFYEFYQMIKRVYDLKLIPFIQIDYAVLQKKDRWRHREKEFVRYLRKIFRFLGSRFPAGFIRQWKIELCCTEEGEQDGFYRFYRDVCQGIREYLDRGSIGGLALRDLSESGKAVFEKFLSYTIEQEIIPGFFTFQAYPEEDLVHAFRGNYQMSNAYYKNMIYEIRCIAGDLGCEAETLYMTRWNTLAGRSLAESGTFFRSALILDVIRSVSPYLDGAGIHLNTYEVSKEMNKTDTSVLALYMCYKIKRPVFFILEALLRAGGDILYQSQDVLITQNQGNEYAVLLNHPCYVNPSHSIDPVFLQQNSTRMMIDLKGLPSGRYRIKTFTMDQGSSGIFNQWGSVGFPDMMDPDVVEYLEQAIVPELRVEETDITDNCRVEESVTFNGVVLKLIRQLQ